MSENELLTKIALHQLTITDLRTFEPDYKKLHAFFSQPEVKQILSAFNILVDTDFKQTIYIEPVYTIRRKHTDDFSYTLEVAP